MLRTGDRRNDRNRGRRQPGPSDVGGLAALERREKFRLPVRETESL